MDHASRIYRIPQQSSASYRVYRIPAQIAFRKLSLPNAGSAVGIRDTLVIDYV
jgi:hypothetical protein